MRPRAIARNTSCYVCLLCPLRTISANATRLRLSLLVVVPRKFCRKAKDFAKGKSVPNDTDFLGGEGWIRLIAQGCTCANCPSVSTERWFGAHSARRFEKPPIHPLNTQKSTSRDTFFVVRGGFAQQLACKFTCQSEVCTPKGGSTRKACWLFFGENSLNPPL